MRNDANAGTLEKHYDAIGDDQAFKPHSTKFDSNYVQQYYSEIDTLHRQSLL